MERKNTAVNIITAIIAVLAIAAAIFAIVTINREETNSPEYIMTEEEKDFLMSSTETLIRNNYVVLRLFYTQGLPHKPEPYNNVPEDGLYTVDSDKYLTLDDVFAPVDETYISAEAQRIKTDPLGNGAVYSARGSELGIDMNFMPIDYNKSWEHIEWEISDITPNEVTILITVTKLNDGGTASENNDTEILSGQILKINGEWKLEKIIY